MKDVRVFFSKKGRLRFISHLDMNRFFTRVLRKSGLPLWYTEGFNPHLYLTFALPLSLGFESEYEVVDFRITDDSLDLAEVADKLSPVLPEDIKIIKVCEPVMKPGKISAAGFDLAFESETEAQDFFRFLKEGNIVVSKKTKRGSIKEINVSEKIISYSLSENTVSLILPAGNDNINPSLLVTEYNRKKEKNVYVSYTRTAVYAEENKLFE